MAAAAGVARATFGRRSSSAARCRWRTGSSTARASSSSGRSGWARARCRCSRRARRSRRRRRRGRRRQLSPAPSPLFLSRVCPHRPPTVRSCPPPPRTARSLPPVARPPRSQGRHAPGREAAAPPSNRKVAALGRETAPIARSPAPDREVTDRDGRSFSGEPWGRLLSSRSEPPTGAVLLELWGHAVQLIRARDPQWLANASHGVPLV